MKEFLKKQIAKLFDKITPIGAVIVICFFALVGGGVYIYKDWNDTLIELEKIKAEMRFSKSRKIDKSKESTLDDYVEYKDRTLFGIIAEASK